ncbi:MAG: hypothetical protein ACOC2H_03615 [Spirochaetota bacterium]
MKNVTVFLIMVMVTTTLAAQDKETFLTSNRDKAFEYTGPTPAGVNRGDAYVAAVHPGYITVVAMYEGRSPVNGKIESFSSVMNIRYDSESGEYSLGDPGSEFELKGTPDTKRNVLDLVTSQGGITLKLTDRPKGAVIPDKPLYFTEHADFAYKSAPPMGEGAKTGTATVREIQKDAVVLQLSYTQRDQRNGKMMDVEEEMTVYYSDGVFYLNKEKTGPVGVAVDSSKRLVFSDENGTTVLSVAENKQQKKPAKDR